MNVRSVAQGEYSVTTDPNTVLLTAGMTECLGVCFVSDKNPAHRLVAHLDGFTLSTPEISSNNIKILIDAFEKASGIKNNTFHIYVLGGSKFSNNIPNFILGLAAHGKNIHKIENSKEFCDKFNSTNPSYYKINPTNAFMTIVSSANAVEPVFACYKPNLTPANISLEKLEQGSGLTDSLEKENYLRFIKANDLLLSKSGLTDEIVTTIRHSSQVDKIVNYLEKLIVERDSKVTSSPKK